MALPDIVRLGGIYMQPDLRGRGYAKVTVAGSLIAARRRGVSRAVLFTSNPSAARSYEAVGFKRIGDYGLVLFKLTIAARSFRGNGTLYQFKAEENCRQAFR